MNIFFRKCFHTFRLFMAHLFLVDIPRFFQDMLDLGNRDHREEFREQEITSEEQPESPDVEADLPDRRAVIRSPTAGYIIPVDREDDDHEPLKPHPDIYDDRHKER